jgi:predicted extracellular nuclease
MSLSRTAPALVAGLALATSGLAVTTATTASANPAGTGLVISEVYGGGGNSGATLTNDFIELYNPTGAAISVNGWSVQYRSSTGTTAQVTSLTGSVPAGGHYLVQQAAGTGGTTPLPTADAIGTIAMSASSGVVLLVPNTTGVSTQGDLAGSMEVVDAVGYGTAATTFEDANTGANLTSTTAATRNASGTDTDHNANDFSEVAPDPQNSSSGPPPEVTIVDATIAEIQGTGAASPFAGVPNTYVRTRGVVTAAYPSGGFFSFVIQTEGTGGGSDATPGASDGIWVRQTSGAIEVEIGDFVEVVAPVQENFTLTRLSYDPADEDQALTELADPHTDPVPLVGDFPTTDAEREAHEGELLDVTGQSFTVTDNFDTNRFAEIGLATGDRPLIHPLDVGAPGSPEADAVAADNEARAVTLDDGSSANYTTGSAADLPVPWLSPTNPIRVGSQATLHAPVILDFQFNVWRFQPTQRVTDEGAHVATFENTRSEDLAPQPLGGDLKLATFNVLNYFNTTGADYEAAGGECTFFEDRDGDPVTNDDCGPTGPRGAAEDEDLERQQAKIVAAINTMDADIVSLEEIENSVVLGEPRDDALAALVAALNADAGSTRWAYVPSPDAAELPPVGSQDVIRTAFIYNPDTVEAVGGSDVLEDDPDFSNAREPLAQAFKAAGADDDTAFAVVVNHFKSKGNSTPPQTGNDNEDTGNGAGAFNGDRTRQAESLVAFADAFATSRGIDKVFLAGDFNSYSQEDPMQVLYDAGYTGIESDTEGEATYSFDGLYGSLDHVLANDAAFADVTGADIWNINSVESVAFEYSRHNNNVTDFYAPDVFRASDHNPEIVGIDVPDAEPVATTVTATADEVPYGTAGEVEVDVESANATSGTVEVRDGSNVLGTASVAEDGTATVTLPPRSLPVGTHTLTVAYSGDAANEPSTGTVTVRVVKAEPTMTVDVDPDRVTTKTPVELSVTLAAPGQTVTGWVGVLFDGHSQVRQLRDGGVEFDLGRFKKAGVYDVWVIYAGSDTAEPVLKQVEIRVVKK